MVYIIQVKAKGKKGTPLKSRGRIKRFNTYADARSYLKKQTAEIRSGTVMDFNKMFELNLTYKVIKV